MAERQGWARCQPGEVLRRAASADGERSAAPPRPDSRLRGALAKSGGGSAPKKRTQGGNLRVFGDKSEDVAGVHVNLEVTLFYFFLAAEWEEQTAQALWSIEVDPLSSFF